MRKTFLISILSFLLASSSFATNDSLQQKEKWRLDSNYVVSYPEKLIFGLFQSWRYYDLLINQSIQNDSLGLSPVNYIARGNNSSGIDFAYDKIAFSLGTSVDATESDIARKGISKTKNLSVSLNSRRYRLEAAYRKYTGFYDNYSNLRDTNFIADSSAYYQNPDMYSKAFRLKGFYFFNKKKRFSYGASFNNSARQLKTAGSFLLVSNLYKYSISAPNNMLPPIADNYYSNWKNINFFQTFGASLNLGYSLNVVLFKKLFANATGTLGLELQKRNYSTNDNLYHESNWDFDWAAGDLRGSIGYNGEKIYIILSYRGDFTVYKFSNIQIDTRLHAGMFTFGYRFKMKENKVTTWLKNNKIYQFL